MIRECRFYVKGKRKQDSITYEKKWFIYVLNQVNRAINIIVAEHDLIILLDKIVPLCVDVHNFVRLEEVKIRSKCRNENVAYELIIGRWSLVFRWEPAW